MYKGQVRNQHQLTTTTVMKLGLNGQLMTQILGQNQSVIHHGLLHLLKVHVLQVLRQILQYQQLSLQQSHWMYQHPLTNHHQTTSLHVQTDPFTL